MKNDYIHSEIPPNFDSLLPCSEEAQDQDWIRERLSRSNVELFTQAACHVFAFALTERLPENTYTIKLVTSESGVNHIYLICAANMIDVRGIQFESPYLEILHQHSTQTIQRGELINSSKLNCFGHCCLPDFVNPALKRAFDLIDNNRAKFGL